MLSYGQDSEVKDSLKAIISTTKQDSVKIIALLNLSEEVDCRDAECIAYISQAYELAKKNNWPKGICAAYIAWGDAQLSCNKDYLKAINCYEQSLAFARSAHSSEYEAKGLQLIGLVYHRTGDYPKAIKYYRRALQIQSNPDVELNVLSNMGDVYYNLGAYPQSLVFYDSALAVLERLIPIEKQKNKSDTFLAGGIVCTIADIYMAMSQLGKAEKNYKFALKTGRESKIPKLVILALKGLGVICQIKKEFDPAIRYYEEAIDSARAISDNENLVPVMYQLSDIYLEIGQIQKADEIISSALSIAEKNKLMSVLPSIYTIYGKVLARQNKNDEAISFVQKSIAISGQNAGLRDEKDAWLVLSNIYSSMKQPGPAFDAYKKYITIRDSVYNLEKANELTRIDLQAGFDRQSELQKAESALRIAKQRTLTASALGSLAVVLLFAFFIYRGYTNEKKANAIITKANEVIKDEKQRAEKLLLNILPEDVAAELKGKGNVQARLFDRVTVLFTDFVNFTEAGERMSPEALVAELNICFMAFDEILSKYNIEKIKTVGDAYMAVAGLPHANPYHAVEIVKAAIDFLHFMTDRRKQLGDKTFAMRIGVNSGTVIAGIVGVKKFAYDIWGDTVNTAARMEQYSEQDKINISQSTYELVKDNFTCVDRGEIDAKHKGKMRMYFVEA